MSKEINQSIEDQCDFSPYLTLGFFAHNHEKRSMIGLNAIFDQDSNSIVELFSVVGRRHFEFN